jgi:hypothetical protein
MCSSASAAISGNMQEDFGVSSTVSRLPVAMFLFGLALGPVVLTPLAEVGFIQFSWFIFYVYPLLILGLRQEEGLNDLHHFTLRVGFPFVVAQCHPT